MLSARLVKDLTVITATGDFDLANAGELRTCLDDAISAGAHHLVLDFSGVTFLDSTALGVLIGARRRLAPAGGRMTFAAPSDVVMQVFQIAHLDQLFTIHASLRDALPDQSG